MNSEINMKNIAWGILYIFAIPVYFILYLIVFAPANELYVRHLTPRSFVRNAWYELEITFPIIVTIFWSLIAISIFNWIF